MNKSIDFGHTKLEWGEVYFYIYTTTTSSATEAGALVSGPVHIHVVTLPKRPTDPQH